MSDADYVQHRVNLLRPRAKFVKYIHSSEFIDQTAQLGQGFHYVNLYDEQIDSNVIKTPRGLILVHNTYLASFAYNLFLCWMLYAPSQLTEEQSAPPSDPPVLTVLLKHNFKKFFAEQLLSFRNDIFSRAVILETLLFEQVVMVPVFEAKASDSELARKAKLGAQLMSSLVSFHELAHCFAAHNPQEWEQVRQSAGGNLAALYEQACQKYPTAFVEEFKCDATSIVACLRLYEPEMGRQFFLQAIIFAFAAFATLSSLTQSAQQTSLSHQNIVDKVDFASLEKRERNYDYAVGIDHDFAERFRLVQAFCENLAGESGLDLYSVQGPMPLATSILSQFLAYVDQVMENSDANARSMAMLVAEALHRHPQGIEYLYLRSKTFDFPTQTDSSA